MQPDPIDVEVGGRLRRAREHRKVSQTALGEAIGVSFQQVQKYERGTNRISASMLVKAARTLQIGPEWFFEGLGPQATPVVDPLAHQLVELTPKEREFVGLVVETLKAHRGR